MKRTTPLARKTRINPVNAERKAENHKRAYGGKHRIEWMKSLPCVACGYHGPTLREVAHVTTGGMGRKADADQTVPLCPPCHRTQHDHGWAALGVTAEWARETAAWFARKWDKWEAMGAEG